jgi:hypothetical protein
VPVGGDSRVTVSIESDVLKGLPALTESEFLEYDRLLKGNPKLAKQLVHASSFFLSSVAIVLISIFI